MDNFEFDFSFSMSESSDSEDEEEFEEKLLLTLLVHRRIRTRKIRNVWVTDIRKDREKYGVFYTLIPQMTDVEFKRYLRVTRTDFEIIHNYIQEDITKQHTNFRSPIPSRERLTICLRFLASGETYRDIAFHFRVGESTVSEIIQEVCDSIWLRMQPHYLPEPDEEFWKEKALDFERRWQFKHCVSAVDGKHVILRKPLKTGSEYWNYKKSFSIVLLAGADAQYRFTFIDVGVKGRFSDGYTFRQSQFGKRLISNELQLPQPASLFPNGPKVPYVIVADAAFPLMENVMRPYPGTSTKNNRENRIFNYRLSHARQTIECAFGILSARFRIYNRALELEPAPVRKIVKATCILHNFLRRDCKSYEEETADIPSTDFVEADDQLINLPPTKARSTRYAYHIRELFKDYFIRRNVIPYQNVAIQRGKY